jgi:hypothetical protein
MRDDRFARRRDENSRSKRLLLIPLNAEHPTSKVEHRM